VGNLGGKLERSKRLTVVDVTLLVLAGGRGTRFGLLNSSLPKSAIPVYDESSLVRNVRQARAAGFKNIVVSTRTSFSKSVGELLASCHLTAPDISVKVVSNRYHRYGALAALLHLLKNVDTPRVALSLPDIFFIENAYHRLYEHSESEGNYLGVADPFDPSELTKGGIVIWDTEQRVCSILETPIAGQAEGVRWTGLAVFNRDLEPYLNEFIAAGGGGAPIGNFFRHYIAKGNVLSAFRVSDFININTADDMFLASMYRAIELHGADNALSRELSQATSYVRQRLLRGNNRRPDIHLSEVELLTSKA
jgi:dTDP-glucose pyrophosphorylase